MNAPSPGDGTGGVAIICGAGNFPYAVADAVQKGQRRAVLFPLRGFADPAAVARYPHHWCHLGQLGRLRRLAHAEGCEQVTCIGGLIRPSIGQLRFDLTTLLLLPRILAAYRGGDAHLLSRMGEIIEQLGFRVVGPHELAPDILVPEGQLGQHAPSARDLADVARGFTLLNTLGRFDIGQAAVIAAHRVVAVEAAEGTDRMLARVAELRRDGLLRLSGKTGVLVKAPKPQQDRRFDLPSVGPRTVEAAAAAGLAGIAVEAKGAITVDLQDMIRAADAAGLFLMGMARPSPASEVP
jgi:UDP-2,3-diacylglucosamine hydrolase